MKAQKTIAITGAGGFVGQALVNYFSSEGWNVIGLVRNPARFATKNTTTTYRQYDVSKPINNQTLDGVDYLVHAAYVKYDASHPDAMQQNLQGAKRLLQTSRQRSIRTVFISSMSAHDEAISVYGRQKLALEELFNTKQDCVLKCGLILGDGGIVKQMSAFMKSKHAVPLIGGGRQPLQVVAVADLVKVVKAVFDQSASGTYVVATPQVYSYKTFYQTLAKHLGIKVLYVPVPYFALQLAFRAAAVARLPLGVGEDNLKGLKMLRAMESATDLQKLGVQLQDLQSALATSGV